MFRNRRVVWRASAGREKRSAKKSRSWLCSGYGCVQMPGLSDSVDLGDGRRASCEAIGHGPPVVYFVGGPGYSAALLRHDAELLADRFAVYLIDPAGSGGSTSPRDLAEYDHLGHARFYHEVADALDIHSAIVMGHSFGGIVALTYAALFPEATTRCVSVASRVRQTPSATRSPHSPADQPCPAMRDIRQS